MAAIQSEVRERQNSAHIFLCALLRKQTLWLYMLEKFFKQESTKEAHSITETRNSNLQWMQDKSRFTSNGVAVLIYSS